MHCPACDRTLSLFVSGKIEFNACEGGCGGIWFDAFEMQKVDDANEKAGEPLLEIKGDPSVKVDLERRRRCPRCETVVMWRHQHRDNPEVIVDECPGCGGFWLDAGELEQIRQSHELVEKRKAHTRELLDHLKERSLADLKPPAEAGARRRRTISSIRAFFRGQPE